MNDKLEIGSVVLEFDSKRVLQDVYLKCETGEVVGLLGRNGAGKSCVFKIIFGELIAASQTVRLNEKTLIGTKRSPERIRYLPQSNFTPKFLTVKRLLRDFEVDFDDLILSFPDFKKNYKSKMIDLSSGQRRIIEIFSILTSKTKFCLLDEPFSQIMPIHVVSLKRLIDREKKNKGIVMTDHMFRDVLEVCNKIYVLKNGKTILTKRAHDLEDLGYARVKDMN